MYIQTSQRAGMLLQLIHFVIHSISALCLVSDYLPSSCFMNSVRSEISLHSLIKYQICLSTLIILQSLQHTTDSLLFESLAEYLLESSIGQEKKIPSWKIIKTSLKIIKTSLKIIKTSLKIIYFISLKIKQITILNSSYEHRDNLSSLSIGVS